MEKLSSNLHEGWWMKAKIYELYIDKFAKDISGLTDRLGYFSRFPVNTLHILPHYPSPMIDGGYDVTDYRAVRPELGSLSDLRRLITAAHKKGLRIIVDFVVNHVSSQHPWFKEARSSRNNPKRDYFLWSETGERFQGAFNPFSGTKPSNWIKNAITNDYYHATFYSEQPDLNWDNEEVVIGMLDNMDFLADFGVDGFRIDAARHLIKRNGGDSMNLPETHQMLKRIRAHLEQKHPDVILLAETPGDVNAMKAYFGNGDECHLVYHFPLMGAIWDTLHSGDWRHIDELRWSFANLPTGCQWATFLRNHDDAVRLASVFSGERSKILKAYELLFSLPGALVCYYGDELGLQNLPPRPEVVDTRLFVRGEFDWMAALAQMDDPNSLFSEIARIISRRS